MNQKVNKRRRIEESPEVKSFIYQQIVDFEPFLTDSTQVSVVSRPPEDPQNNSEAGLHNILFSINENGVSIEEEGCSDNIYEAILEAKNKLYKKLVSIQDSVVSQKDRLAQIQSLKLNKKIQ